jgi:hypothetical protein
MTINLTNYDMKNLKEVKTGLAVSWGLAYARGVQSDEIIQVGNTSMTFEEFTTLFNTLCDIVNG